MPGKQRDGNGTPFAYQIPAYSRLLARSLARDADRIEEQAKNDGTPLVVEAEVDFLRAAADEARDWHTATS
jgi:hypothetical protein